MSVLLILLYIAAGIAWVVIWAEIFLKAGYNRWLCFVMIVPVANLAALFWFAFSKWPVYEFVEKDWHIKKLISQQEKIEREIQSISRSEELPKLTPKLTKEEKLAKLEKIAEQVDRDVAKAKEASGK